VNDEAGRAESARLSRQLEEACDFVGAARHALAAGDARRAAHLAVLGGDDALCQQAMDTLVANASREQTLAAAVDLVARGFHKQAGALFERAGAHLDAAAAFAAGSDAVRASRCFARGGRPVDGARALEVAIRRTPERGDQRLALGRLLARHGKLEAAARALQQIDPHAPERAASLVDLFRCLEGLGLHEAAREVREELRARGSAEGGTRASDDGALEGAERPASPHGVEEAPASAAPPAAAAPAGGPLLFGRYEIVREVAATPNARLVEATDKLNGERVAVKIFATAADGAGRDAWIRFEREARALALLRHPNVLPLRAYLPESGAMVLAWMAGGSLADKLASEPIAPARAVEITSAVLSALGEAHRLGILHRDVKPSNILFDEAGSTYLADFGAAHLGDLSSTATAGAIGTFAYMSPEQRLGRSATLASDLYGVGAVLAEMLTGSPPATASDEPLAHLPSTCHPDVKPVHDALVLHLVATDPVRRPADAFEARRGLLAIPWPSRLLARAEARPRIPSVRPVAVATERFARLPRPPATLPPGLAEAGAELGQDTWLGRDVVVLPLDEAELARARAFARAGHPVLPAVLRADLTARQIWVAPALGEPLRRAARPLTRGQQKRLRDAIAALHAVGGAHGRIDADHIHVVAGDVTLAYPFGRAPDGAEAADLAALAALEKQ
jgi:tetratricopeptide (TPR) repeat protein